jgi:hypothetical protein
VPKYKVALSDGRTFIVDADGPPSEADVLAHLGNTSQQTQAPVTPPQPKDPLQARKQALENQALGDPVAEGERASSTLNAMRHPIDALMSATGISHPLENLPTLAGFAASIAGGGKTSPVGASLAALAGAGGAGIRNSVEAFTDPDALKKRGVDPTSVGSMLMDMGTAGAIQGGVELGGRKLMQMAGAAGHGLVDRALDPSKRLAERAPNVVEDFVKQGATLSKSGEKAAWNKATAGAAKADQMVGQAVPHAPFMTLDEILAGLEPKGNPYGESTKDWIAKNYRKTPDLEKTAAFANDVRADNPTAMPIDQVHQMTRRAGELAEDAFVKGGDDATLNEKMQRDVYAKGHKFVSDNVPGFKEHNLETQSFGNVAQAITDAMKRQKEGLQGFMVRHGLASTGALGAVVGAATQHPEAGIAAAIPLIMSEILTNPQVESEVGKKLVSASRLPLANVARGVSYAAPQMSGLADWVSRYLQEQPTQK